MTDDPTDGPDDPAVDSAPPPVADHDPSEPRVIPKLPRARHWSRVTTADLVRIAMFATLLVAVVILREPCGEAVSNFFKQFDPPPDAGVVDNRGGMELIRFDSLEDIERQFPRQAPAPDAGLAEPPRDGNSATSADAATTAP